MAGEHASDPTRGLSAAEVAERVARGQTNAVPPSPSRTLSEIMRANVLTRFNALMATLVAIVLVAGAYRDALFGGVIVANSLVGIIQELRAKRVLDRLAVLSAPVARTVRDGQVLELTVDDLVLDDVLELRPGGQIAADAVLLTGDALEVDESLLTGEADPEPKAPGDELLSGSFVVSGSGRAQVSKVGADAYAAKLAEEARRFTLVNSELRAAIDRIVTWVSWALVPVGTVLFITQVRVHDGIRKAMVKSVAGMIGMVPEGLVLLTSVAFAVGVVRLAMRRTLVRELPAVETLARVDVLCLDKTGTITEGSMVVERIVALDDDVDSDSLDAALAAVAWADPNPNATQQALAERYPDAPAGWATSGSIPFSSARKWSAAGFEGHGWWVLGAPEMMLGGSALAAIRDTVDEAASSGIRVLLLARCGGPVDAEGLPDDLRATALVMVTDKIRPDANETLAYFAAQDVTLKVISGDNPVTVSAVAERAGLAGAGHYVDARELPEDDLEALADAVEATTVFGRVSPHLKREMVKALQSRGHTVAMTGDGVNDVLALKDSDCGIAMASGSEATRAVAQIVLLDSSFAGLPHVVAEGRRVINNLQRVASLFLTKTTYAIVFALFTGLGGIAFPFLPRQLTLISTMCIGVPSFFLALAPNTNRVQGDFLRTVARDSVPYGLICATATLTTFLFARSEHVGETAEGSAATLVLASCSLLVLLRNARPLRGWKIGLVATMSAMVALAFATRVGRDYFALSIAPETAPDSPIWRLPGDTLAVAGSCIAAAAVVMVVVHRILGDGVPAHDPGIATSPGAVGASGSAG